MELLQFLYITPLNLVYKVTGKIPAPIRHGIIGVSFFSIIAFFLFCYSSVQTGFMIDYDQRGWLNMIPLSIIILMSVDRPLKAIKWNPFLSTPWMICGMILFFVCLFFDIGSGFFPFAVCMLFLFPCLYFVWNNRQDYDVLFTLAAKAMVVSVLLFFLICVLFYPMSEETMVSGRYLATTGNANTLGTIAASATTCSLYLLFKKRKAIVVYMIACEIAISLLILSESRTSLISVFLQLGVFVIFYVRYYMSEHDRLKAMIRLCVLLLLILSCLPINTALLSRNADASAYGVSDGKQVDQRQTKEYKNTDKADQRKEKPAKNGPQETKLPSEPVQEITIFDRLHTQGGDLNQLSSGRVAIWLAYLQKIGWKGHTEDQLVKVAVESDQNRVWAHNVFLELAWRFGIGVALIYLFITIYNGIYVLKCVCSKKFYNTHRHCVFSAFSIISFCVISMLEMVVFPLERDFVFLYFIGIAPLFKYNKKLSWRAWKKRGIGKITEKRLKDRN